MNHDPLCPALEGGGLFVAYAGPVGGSDHIDCLTCYIIARVREDERSNIDREMAFAHKVGYDRGRADIRDEGRNTG